MELHLTRPLIFFDIESTGLQVSTDRIIELCYIKVMPDGTEKTVTQRFNPQIPIPAESTAVHGIHDEDVAQCPTFAEKAAQIAADFKHADLAGFNSNNFDIPLLYEEFVRAGVAIDLSNCRMIDVQNIFHKMEKRTLEAAYQFYCGKTLEDAHSAEADTRATYEVLKGQLDRYGAELQNDVTFLADFSRRNRNVDFAGRIVLDDNGTAVINFGKYRGKPVVETLRRDPGYYNWIMQGDFTQNTKQVFTKYKLLTKNN
ncbi:MAG: exonuclease domain-containing protein [Alloprevotella sp.]|nr:3'-5' exonuclease [Bacteroidales bacterium]MDY2604597.1 exonuclease domain-containing protein [Alloprevotella sp.]MCI6104764.1 3'-5' exonuclease [Bacteroidales bacterium]MCI6252673.1 3'-5' exonuclease [Bacteroidales bacterium]MDY4029991.1 exonuclease domain-containing protein [Alloprevotella sp.]